MLLKILLSIASCGAYSGDGINVEMLFSGTSCSAHSGDGMTVEIGRVKKYFKKQEVVL